MFNHNESTTLRWPPQPTDFNKHKNGSSLDFGLKYGVVVAECDL